MEIRDRRSGFLWINNEIVDDYAPQLAPMSVLVYMYLCRHANNDSATCWPSQSKIAEFCRCTDRTVRSSLKELEGIRLITIERRRIGEITQNVYTLLNPLTNGAFFPAEWAKPTGNDFPVTERPTGNLRPKQPEARDPLTRLIEQDSKHIIAGLPDWIPSEQWNGFVQMRRQMHKIPFTERAQRLAIAELEKLKAQGHDPGAVLDQSTMKGWRGLFPISQGNGGKSDSYKTAAQRRDEQQRKLIDDAFRRSEEREKNTPADLPFDI